MYGTVYHGTKFRCQGLWTLQHGASTPCRGAVMIRLPPPSALCQTPPNDLKPSLGRAETRGSAQASSLSARDGAAAVGQVARW